MSTHSIDLIDVSHGNGDVEVLQHVHTSFSRGFTGLVGANGAGKTTLLRLLAAELQPDEGVVRISPSTLHVVFVPQEDEEDIDARMSPGERRIVAIERALAMHADVLLLDEPTNHLDGHARLRLLQLLRTFRGIGVVVSHDRAFLDELTVRTALIRNRTVRIDDVPYSRASETWAIERDAAFAAREVARSEVDRRAAELRRRRENERGAEAMRSARNRMRNAHDSDARGLLAQGRADNGAAAHARRAHIGERELARAQRAFDATDDAVAKELQLGRSFAFAFDADKRAPPLLSFVDGIAIARETRLHIDGNNGAGKTTLMRSLIANLRVPVERVFNMPQELDEDDVVDVSTLARDVRGRVMQLVAALGADPNRVLRSAHLSPGERKKLALAFALAHGTWALFLDEPTNHLDLPSIERMQAALRAFPGALVLITHDRELAKQTTTERLHLPLPMAARVT